MAVRIIYFYRNFYRSISHSNIAGFHDPRLKQRNYNKTMFW